MSQLNPVDAEIDELIAHFSAERVKLGDAKSGTTTQASKLRYDLRRQILSVVNEQIEYKGVGVFCVKPPLFRALRDNRQTLKNSRSDDKETADAEK